MKKIFLIASVFVFVFFSCDKKQDLNEEFASSLKIDTTSMTLEEFASSLETEEERDFFETHRIMDYTDIAAQALRAASNGTIENPRFQIKFKWFVHCQRPFGICFIFSFAHLDETNATMYFYDGKCVIVPDSDSDNGLTSDGYLPIFRDIPIDDELLVKEGIYKAYYDWDLEKYAIAVDIVRR